MEGKLQLGGNGKTTSSLLGIARAGKSYNYFTRRFGKLLSNRATAFYYFFPSSPRLFKEGLSREMGGKKRIWVRQDLS